MNKALTPLLALCLALLAGCADSPSDTGSAQLAVLLPRSGAASISRVSVTASAEDLPAATVELADTHGLQGGMLGNLPAGSQRSFLAQAFDASGHPLFQGSASGVSISAGQSSLIAMTLQALNAPPASLNEPPVIDSLVAASTSVPAGGSVTLQAAAHGLHPDEPLSYAWSSTAGTFSPASGASTSWTAPASSGTQTLTLTVTDSGGVSSSASLDLTVLPSGGQGTAQLTVSFNNAPRVDALSAPQLAVGQSSPVSVSASDSDGDSLSYAWSATCAGSWAQADSPSARFTPSALPSGTCNNCELTVSVSDGRGGQTTGTLALCVTTTPVPPRFNPLVIGTFSSLPPWEILSEGQVLTYEVVATDPQGSALSFSWAANAGSLGTAASTGSHSRTTWTAPACVSEGTVPTITATVTNAFNLTATSSFEVMGLPTCYFTTWTATGPMASARYNHRATLLNTGQVLVTGGQGTPAAAEVYTPSSGRWSAAGAMPSPRYNHAATLLQNGTVLVSGGYNANATTYLAAAELYNPASNTWSTTGSMLSPRYLHAATRLLNGQVLVAGGVNNGTYLSAAELYNPASGTWSATGPMGLVRAYHTATLLNNGKVLVVGGRGAGSSSYTATAELYDPASGTWSATGPMASTRASHTATLLSDGRVLVTGGANRNVLATAEVYNPVSGTWSSAGTMTTQRANHTATLLPNGKVLIAGGSNLLGYLITAELYDPALGTWTAADSMASPRGNHTATRLNNGQVLISGGSNGSTPLSATELYTP
jgi:N-acetylneuraminic acid mutarotase